MKPGGTLVYAVCSLQDDEGPARPGGAAGARQAASAASPVEQAELRGLGDAITPAGDVRTLPSMWPERRGLDGFFIGRLQKS